MEIIAFVVAGVLIPAGFVWLFAPEKYLSLNPDYDRKRAKDLKEARRRGLLRETSNEMVFSEKIVYANIFWGTLFQLGGIWLIGFPIVLVFLVVLVID